MTTPKTGPLTQAELQELWESVTDPSYSRPFVELGEGEGFEAYTQFFAQLARVSEAVDTSTQARFITPFSGQTAPPAAGAAKATVTLSLARTRGFERALVLPAGFAVEEEQIDAGELGGVPTLTGRRYLLTQALPFAPGEAGRFDVLAEALAFGPGFNHPRPGTLHAIVQPGTHFENDRATVEPGVSAHRLLVRPEPDVVIPEHVGQILEFTGGANVGQRRRIVGYAPPEVEATPPHGGIALLAPEAIYRLSAVAGSFAVGETIEQPASGATLRFVRQTPTLLLAERLSGTLLLGPLLVGQLSGALATADAVELSPDLVAEAGTASWRILDWAADLGVTATNEASPAGGLSADLDELAEERGVYRRNGEGDPSIARRGGALADVVSPNALVRAVNRVIASYGGSAILREVGLPGLRGFFFDGDPTSTDPNVAFAFDLDRLTVTGVATGVFSDGEIVKQDNGGVVALGRAVLSFPVPAGVLPQPLPDPALAGLCRVWGSFAPGVPIVGQTSGASIALPVFSGGLKERDRWKVLLDYTEFRAFFLMGFAAFGLGDFGFAFDAGASNAFDAAPWLAFLDGQPLTEANLNRAVWIALNEAKAGGVGFDLVRDAGS